MKTKKNIKKRSQKQEKSVAKKFRAKLTPASGALWAAKGDVRTDKFLIECKTTEKRYYVLTAKVWEKIAEEALKDHMRTPLMVIDLEDSERYVVFSPKDFEKTTVHPLIKATTSIQKSIRIYKGLVGDTSDYDYVYSRQFIIEGERKSILHVMLLKDFEEEFKEEL